MADPPACLCWPWRGNWGHGAGGRQSKEGGRSRVGSGRRPGGQVTGDATPKKLGFRGA
jgi:hypothetical protein